MKSHLTLIGTVLIVLGIVGFSYKYFTYTTTEQVARIGPVEVTAEKEKAVFISPAISGAVFAAGIVLVLVGLKRK